MHVCISITKPHQQIYWSILWKKWSTFHKWFLHLWKHKTLGNWFSNFAVTMWINSSNIFGQIVLTTIFTPHPMTNKNCWCSDNRHSTYWEKLSAEAWMLWRRAHLPQFWLVPHSFDWSIISFSIQLDLIKCKQTNRIRQFLSWTRPTKMITSNAVWVLTAWIWSSIFPLLVIPFSESSIKRSQASFRMRRCQIKVTAVWARNLEVQLLNGKTL